jgi:hypothetical protein
LLDATDDHILKSDCPSFPPLRTIPPKEQLLMSSRSNSLRWMALAIGLLLPSVRLADCGEALSPPAFVPGSWTLAVLPDPQEYNDKNPGLSLLQTHWIAKNKDKYNIRYVLGLGDMTNHDTDREWRRVREAMDELEGKVPYVLVPGNHDYKPGGDLLLGKSRLSQCFPLSNYLTWPTFGGAMKEGETNNSYHLFSAGGVDWICADKSEWKIGEETLGKWAPLWFGAWTTDVDLRPEFKRWGLDPVRQGRRGTCSVFTTTSALEFAFSRYTGKSVRLSVEYLNWAANQATGHATDGQFFHNCLAGFGKFGICYNADMPYATKFDAKLAPSEKAMANAHELRATADRIIRLHWIKRLKPKAPMTDAQLHEIRAVLAIGWPVAAGARHSRLLVGYHDDPQQPGGGVFLTKDSGSGRYKRVTYEFVKGKVGDVFWVEALINSQ